MQKSRTKTLGLHGWTRNDTILCLYYTKYGTNGLYLNTDDKLASFIGVTSGSLKMQSMNFRALMGFSDKILTDYSELQRQIFEEFNSTPIINLRKIVQNIIGQDDFQRNALLKQFPGRRLKLVA